MKMSKLEQAAKNQIIDILNKQGYPTYAKLLDKLDVKLIDTTKNPNDIAYLAVNQATIYFNPNLSINQVSTIARHEILHEYLTHMARAEKFKQSDPKYKNLPHQLINVAADYEISNRGYTDSDKNIARSIILNDQVLQGLVTEDQYPGWENKTFEEMLAELSKDMDKYQDVINQMFDLGDIPPEAMPGDEDEDQTSQQAQQIQQQAQQAGNQSSDKENKKEAEDISQEADQVKDQIDKNNKSKAQNKGPFETDKQKQVDEETEKKVAELKKALSELKQNIMDETDEKIEQELAAKRAKDAARYKDSPMSRFTDSLNQFIKKEVATGRGPSWSRINKKYIGTGLLKAGSSRLASGHIPLINVYFDRSGSWDSNKTVKGAQAIATLNKYVNRGEIKINLYYFSNNIHSNEQDALSEGGTKGQPILNHIQATKPDNVIILTDSDISDCRTDVTVPGAVWMLFYDGRSENLINHLHGKRLTKYFDIEVR